MNNKAKAKRIIKVYYECIGVNTEYTINYIAAELDRIDSEERLPMPVSSRDWPDDFQDENGNYSCMCFACGNIFTGHKRRNICKVCAEKSNLKQPPMTDSALVQEVRQAISAIGEVRQYSAEGCLIKAASRLCDEFDAAIKRGLAAAETVQVLTKKLEKYENGL